MIANIGDLPYVVAIAVIVLIGGSQLPKIARNLGLAGKEFRKAHQEAEDEAEQEKATTPPAPRAVGPATVPAPLPPTPEESVTLSRSELDALLKAREEQARREATGPSDTANPTT